MHYIQTPSTHRLSLGTYSPLTSLFLISFLSRPSLASTYLDENKLSPAQVSTPRRSQKGNILAQVATICFPSYCPNKSDTGVTYVAKLPTKYARLHLSTIRAFLLHANLHARRSFPSRSSGLADPSRLELASRMSLG